MYRTSNARVTARALDHREEHRLRRDSAAEILINMLINATVDELQGSIIERFIIRSMVPEPQG